MNWGPRGPAVGDVRAALERICASSPLAGSRRLTSFLRFVVEASLDGRADRLKGYTIGTEALGRPPDFDPQADPIVRVEAMRLRRAVARYYAGPGTRDPVIVELLPGSYAPVFRWRAAVAAAPRLLRAIQAARRLLFSRVVITLRPPADSG